MPSYVFAENVVEDCVMFDDHVSRVGGTVSAYGGSYLVRAGRTETPEGDWTPNGLVIIEFESMEKARGWYNSPDYSAIKGLGQNSDQSSLVMVEGIKQTGRPVLIKEQWLRRIKT